MSLSVGKRFQDTYREAGLDRSNSTALNNFHTGRYNEFFERAGGGSIGKPVVPVYKLESMINPEVSSRRGMDDRHKTKEDNRVQRKFKDFSSLIIDRPLG
tara:strand:- start:3180 stop:3479 length:300 start_codon:yes stop_codon:yes gene_type:complete